tara:strand:+ start:39 stop:524 length:486 start_codon:yes stop_codon:yes gene_type:complete
MSKLEVKELAAPTGYDLQMPAGHIVQVVQGSTDTNVSSSSTTFSDTGLTATITPTSANSKILVVVHQNGGYKNAGNAANKIIANLFRGSTDLTCFSRDGGYAEVAIEKRLETMSTSYLDSPATTSATTYKTQFRNGVASAEVRFQTSGTSTSTITLMEVAG